ncbi:hypothetical protein [Saccharolobus sp.]|uniref:hypothetical protein n=1 Tax=Saccharolobus sp. TaxID=2100761 RepID=UPI003177477A
MRIFNKLKNTSFVNSYKKILLSIIFLFFPAYWYFKIIAKYQVTCFHYPFGWDAPRYIADANYILIRGFTDFLQQDKRMIITSAIFSILRFISPNDFSVIIAFTFILIFLPGLVYSIIIYKLLNQPIFSVISLAVFFTIPAINYLYAGLYSQTIALSIGIFLLHILEKNLTFKKMVSIVMMIIVLWVFHKETLALLALSYILVSIYYIMTEKRRKTIIVYNSLIAATFLLTLLIYITLINPQYLKWSVVNLESISKTRTPLTLEKFMYSGFGSIFMFLLYCIGLTISALNKKYREKLIYFTCFNLLGLIIIILSPLEELKYRVMYVLSVPLYSTISLKYVIDKKGIIKFSFKNFSRKVRPESFIYIFVLMILFVNIQSQINTIDYVNGPIRTWATKKDDSTFFRALQYIRSELYLKGHTNTYVFTASPLCCYSDYTMIHYLRSFVPAVIIKCNKVDFSYEKLSFKECKIIDSDLYWYNWKLAEIGYSYDELDFKNFEPNNAYIILVLLSNLLDYHNLIVENCSVYLPENTGCVIFIENSSSNN